MMMQQSFNRRHSPNRRRTRVKALLHIDDRIEQIVIRDVSYEGMKLAVDEDIEVGTAVTVQVASENIPAIVHWSKGGFAGLHLLRRLERQTLVTLETADDELADFR